jgi:hypothetical protein
MKKNTPKTKIKIFLLIGMLLVFFGCTGYQKPGQCIKCNSFCKSMGFDELDYSTRFDSTILGSGEHYILCAAKGKTATWFSNMDYWFSNMDYQKWISVPSDYSDFEEQRKTAECTVNAGG